MSPRKNRARLGGSPTGGLDRVNRRKQRTRRTPSPSMKPSTKPSPKPVAPKAEVEKKTVAPQVAVSQKIVPAQKPAQRPAPVKAPKKKAVQRVSPRHEVSSNVRLAVLTVLLSAVGVCGTSSFALVFHEDISSAMTWMGEKVKKLGDDDELAERSGEETEGDEALVEPVVEELEVKLSDETRRAIRARLEALMETPEGKELMEERTYTYQSSRKEYTFDLMIGDPQVVVFPYEKLKDVCTPMEYFLFLRDSVTSPEEAAKIIDKRVIKHKKSDGILHPRNPDDTFGSGIGDCDDVAFIACDSLRHLGEKTGVDYNPRIIGQDLPGDTGHAACAYTVSGQDFLIDQKMPEPYDRHLYEASGLFIRPRGEYQYHGFSLSPHEVALRWSMEKDFGKDYVDLYVYVLSGEYDSSEFDPDDLLPEDWTQYKDTWVKYNYDEKDETSIHYKSGVIRSVKYSSGKIEEELFTDEDLVQIKYREGDLEYEMFQDGTISSKIYRSGEIKRENFDADGELIQRSYREGSIKTDKYEEEKLTIRVYRRGKVEKEFYDDQREVTQRDYRNGDRDLLKNGKLSATIYASGRVKQKIYDENGELDYQIYREGPLLKEFFEYGKVIQKDYRSGGEIERDFLQNGQLKERVFRRGQYKRVWYEGGKPIQGKTFGGDVVHF